MSDTLLKTIFGRLTLESFPIHEPIILGTFIAVMLGSITLVGAITYFKLWKCLWT